jgi:uncharacterized membrane protein
VKAFLTASVLLLLVSACSTRPSYPEAQVVGGAVVVDTSLLRPGEPLFLSHRFEGKCINFFVISIQDRVMSFYDACNTCYLQKKGFSYEPGFVTCRACGESFSVEDIENGIGSCYPIRLPGRMENDRYIIDLKELRAQARKF